MRKAIRLLALSAICYTAVAQEKSEYKITFDKVTTKVVLPPAIRELDKSVKYYVEYPEQLSYFKVQRGNEIWGINNIWGIDIGAKRAKKAEEADYIFRITTPGLKFSPANPEYFAENRRASYYAPAASVKGFIYRFRYAMPIKIEVVNKQGTVEKTFLFNTDSATAVYHSNFLLDARSTEAFMPEKDVVPFNTEALAIDALTKNGNEVYKRMEYNAWYNAMDHATKVLDMAYGRYQIPVKYFYSKVLKSKGNETFPVIAEAVKKQFEALQQLEEEKKAEAAMVALKQNASSFDNLVTSLGNYDNNVQRVILSNACWASLLTGQTKKAIDYFQKYQAIEKEEYDMYDKFKSALAVYWQWDLIAQPETVVKMNNGISGILP